MVYVMSFYVDGGCRRNGSSNAIGAAAACLMTRNPSRYITTTEVLSTEDFKATSQRAEIFAIILALRWALEKIEDLNSNPVVEVTIHTDSKYAFNCMTTWIRKWTANGWRNSRGNLVENRELIEEASELNDRLIEFAALDYVRITREENTLADAACNEVLDELDKAASEVYDSSDDSYY